MELILIRHGLPQVVQTTDGSPADPDLDLEGLTQAQQLARWLAPEGIDHIYSSPMQRALQTAAPLADTLGLETRVCEGVSEFDRNADSYIPLEKLRELDPARWRALMSGGWDFGDDDAQSFQRRVVNALGDIVDSHAKQRVAVFCHGGVINMWAAAVLSLGPRMFFPPMYTSIHRFRARDRALCTVMALNESAHLRQA